jgi:parvulin-like peptidyl-prolyl isomerase
MTMADLRRQLERTMLVQRVQQTEIMQKLQVTDTELKAYYETHRNEFVTTPQITLREITINVPVTAQGVNVAQDDAAKAKAEEVRAKIIAGEPFPRLAADYSDSGSKANGGLVGPLSRGDLSEELQKAIAGMKTGDVTPVLRTARGYQIIKIENCGQDRRFQAPRRIREVHRQVARRGDHRLEERRDQEGLRSRPATGDVRNRGQGTWSRRALGRDRSKLVRDLDTVAS